MQIYVVGPHKTGKTTLARYLSDKLGLDYVDEIAKSYLEKTRRNWYHKDDRFGNKTMDSFEYAGFQSMLSVYYSELKRKTDFVADRSLMDVYAYSLFHISNNFNEIRRDATLRLMWKNLLHFFNDRVNYDLRPNTLYILSTNYVDEAGEFVLDCIISLINRLGIRLYNGDADLIGPYFIKYYDFNVEKCYNLVKIIAWELGEVL